VAGVSLVVVFSGAVVSVIDCFIVIDIIAGELSAALSAASVWICGGG